MSYSDYGLSTSDIKKMQDTISKSKDSKNTSLDFDMSIWTQNEEFAKYDEDKDGKFSSSELFGIGKAATESSDTNFKTKALSLLEWIVGKKEENKAAKMEDTSKTDDIDKTDGTSKTTDKEIAVNEWGKGNNDCLYNIVKNNYPELTTKDQIWAKVDEVAKANNIKDVNVIQTGQTIKLSGVKAADSSSDASKTQDRKALEASLTEKLKGTDLEKFLPYATEDQLKAISKLAESKDENVLKFLKDNKDTELGKEVTDFNAKFADKDLQAAMGTFSTLKTERDGLAKENLTAEQQEKAIAEIQKGTKVEDAVKTAKGDSTASTTAATSKTRDELSSEAQTAIDKLPDGQTKNKLKGCLYLATEDELKTITDTCNSMKVEYRAGGHYSGNFVDAESQKVLDSAVKTLSSKNEALYKAGNSYKTLTDAEKTSIQDKIRNGQISSGKDIMDEANKLILANHKSGRNY